MPAGGLCRRRHSNDESQCSTASKLKIVGDINSDGSIVYVEYTCDWVAVCSIAT